MKNKKGLIKRKSILLIIVIYLLFLFGASIHFMVAYKIRNALMSFLFMLFVPLMFLVERWFKVEFGFIFVLLSLFIASGAILGACFDVYHLIPCFDEVLHTVSGFLFASLGFALVRSIFVRNDNKKHFYSSLVFGGIFSLAIAMLWELLEYSINVLFGFDMLADSYIFTFNSYLLSGTHDNYAAINDISKTMIYYGDNNVLELSGYLDIGLYDSMNDMFVCFIGTVFFFVVCSLDNIFIRKINKYILPHIY